MTPNQYEHISIFLTAHDSHRHEINAKARQKRQKRMEASTMSAEQEQWVFIKVSLITTDL